jgi:hypothetical protein
VAGGLSGVLTCVAAAVVLGGCGGGDGSSPEPSTTRGSVKSLGKANADQRRRARHYTACLSKHVKRRQLTFQKGTGTSPPVIKGVIRGTRFGINLSSSPAGAKRIEQKLRKSGNKALYRRGSTLIGFAGRKPRPADITVLTDCADKIG